MYDFIALLMFPALFIAMLMGFHVAFSMMGIAMIFGILTFGDSTVFVFVSTLEAVSSNFLLAAVPLFIFMGSVLERSGIADRLFHAINLWTRNVPGGTALGTVALCIVFAASAGVVGATEAIVGLLAIPAMMKQKYCHKLISGVVCAGGSLGTVIPPSITVIIMGAVADVSIGALFQGMIVPGMMIAMSYILYILFVAIKNPERAPKPIYDEDEIPDLSEKLKITLIALVPPIILIFAVLGTIIFGLAAPTEAAAIGALASLFLAFFYKKLNIKVLNEAMLKTVKVTSMILMIFLAGSMFAGIFTASGGLAIMQDFIENTGFGIAGTLAIVLIIAFIGGFFLDWISIVLLVIPIFMPVMISMGVDPIWFCILFLIVIQTSYLTPPLAPAIFFMRGIAPPEIKLSDMYKGVIPFIIIHLIVLAVIIAFPNLVTL